MIKDHLDWHSAAHEAKMYYIPKSLITKVIDHLTEQELSDFAQSMINDLQDMSLLLRGEFNFWLFNQYWIWRGPAVLATVSLTLYPIQESILEEPLGILGFQRLPEILQLLQGCLHHQMVNLL